MRLRLFRVPLGFLAALALLVPSVAVGQQVDTVRFPIPRDDGSLTPYTFEIGYPLVSLIYDTLTLRDANGVPRPLLAQSVHRSGRTLTIELRHNARWQDGTALTADDVVFSYDYYRDHRHPRFTPELADVASVSAAGRYGVTIQLSRPSLGALDQPLADVPIIPRHLWAGLPAGQKTPGGLPVGSGPYRLVRRDASHGYRFEANRRYFLGPPRVSRIEVPIVAQSDRMLDQLSTRRVDAVQVTPQDSAEGENPGELRVERGPSYLGTVLLLNTRRDPFRRPALRRAVGQALDLTRISRAAGNYASTRGVRPAEHGYLSPLSPWASRATLHRFDPDAARLTFAEQGVVPFTVLAPNDDPIARDAAQQVVVALQSAGAPATLDSVPSDEVARRIGERGGAPEFDAAMWSSPPLASYDPAFLRAVFASQGATLNDAGYASPEFDRLADQVSDASSRAARRRAVDAELRLLARDLPVVPLFYADAQYVERRAAYSSWVFVRGTGIFDKRSFLPQASAAGPRSNPPVGNPADRSDGGDFSLFPFILGAAALLAVVAAWRALRTGARR